tara:strand:- start:7178 stop:7378 length:201 start_codon:yes stop_codon:yes gene_type:complete
MSKERRMRDQREGECRKEYLARVSIEYLRNNVLFEELIKFDDAECDGDCLADDIESAWGFEKELTK